VNDLLPRLTTLAIRPPWRLSAARVSWFSSWLLPAIGSASLPAVLVDDLLGVSATINMLLSVEAERVMPGLTSLLTDGEFTDLYFLPLVHSCLHPELHVLRRRGNFPAPPTFLSPCSSPRTPRWAPARIPMARGHRRLSFWAMRMQLASGYMMFCVGHNRSSCLADHQGALTSRLSRDTYSSRSLRVLLNLDVVR
jgi:hypothetical protein